VAFATALSAHPISSHATGEVVGQLLEAVGAHQDLLVLLATPGHRGALEDIVATARRLLAPGLLLAAVSTGLGTGDEYIGRGPGLAAWSASCGPVVAVGPGEALPFRPVGAITLGAGTPGPDAAGWRRQGVPVAAGAVDGPVIVDGPEAGHGSSTGDGPVGIVFGPDSGFRTAVVHGLRGLGPGLTVTRADGTMVYELDGQPALHRLFDVARDGMPAADLPRLAEGLHLRVAATGTDADADPLAVLGADRDNGAIAVHGPVRAGAVVQFARADPDALRAALVRSFGPAPRGALVLSPAGRGLAGPDDRGSGDDGFVEPPSALPTSTLVVATHLPPSATVGRSADHLTATTVAYFT
jgi:small ligand-binding sensory domain FIST